MSFSSSNHIHFIFTGFFGSKGGNPPLSLICASGSDNKFLYPYWDLPGFPTTPPLYICACPHFLTLHMLQPCAICWRAATVHAAAYSHLLHLPNSLFLHQYVCRNQCWGSSKNQSLTTPAEQDAGKYSKSFFVFFSSILGHIRFLKLFSCPAL